MDYICVHDSDVSSVAGYAQEAMAWAVQNGIMGGHSDNTLRPANTATRGAEQGQPHRHHLAGGLHPGGLPGDGRRDPRSYRTADIRHQKN